MWYGTTQRRSDGFDEAGWCVCTGLAGCTARGGVFVRRGFVRCPGSSTIDSFVDPNDRNHRKRHHNDRRAAIERAEDDNRVDE
jgi:hypothetical protein